MFMSHPWEVQPGWALNRAKVSQTYPEGFRGAVGPESTSVALHQINIFNMNMSHGIRPDCPRFHPELLEHEGKPFAFC